MSYGDPYAQPEEGGAAGTESLPWNNVDITDWTLNNPSGIGTPNITQVPSGELTMTWEGMLSSIQDNVPTAGSTNNAPRIYIPLERPDGSQYRFDDFPNGNVTLRVKIYDFDRPADTSGTNNPEMNCVIGLANEPTNTSQTTTRFAGFGAGFTGITAQRSFYVWAGAANTLTNINHRTGIASVTFAGNGGGAVDALTFRADGTNETRNSRNTNMAPIVARTGPIYLMLTWGPSQTGRNLTGQELKMKIAYQIVSFDSIT